MILELVSATAGVVIELVKQDDDPVLDVAQGPDVRMDLTNEAPNPVVGILPAPGPSVILASSDAPISVELHALMQGPPGPAPRLAFDVIFAAPGTAPSATVSGTDAQPVISLAIPQATQTTLAFPFSTPSTTWNIIHGQGRFPSVTVIDSSGSEIAPDITYLDGNAIRIDFAYTFAGVAYLN